ncbi:MAG: class I SAM-dependent methyltransferase [Pirellulaceae bacterium]
MRYRSIMRRSFCWYGALTIAATAVGCRQTSQATSNEPKTNQFPLRCTGKVEDFERELAVFETVFWEPDDTTSLRQLIRTTELVKGKRILEIGTGTGLISLCCLQAGAERVIATDINPAAVQNAIQNAEWLELPVDRFDVRLVSKDDTSAFAVLGPNERFDVIISNPPWENGQPSRIDGYALYDSDFALLKSILSGFRPRLNPEGRLFLAYGCVEAIRTIQQMCDQRNLTVQLLDDRNLSELPNLFLPGMLIEVIDQR